MSEYDEYDDDWGYDGDHQHDMWVDYTTDMYEDTDYSGENPDYDVDWDAEYEANVDYHHEPERHYGNNGSTHQVANSALSMSVQQYEHRIHQLEMLIAAALASAATLDAKSANASTPKNIQKYQRRASEKQSEAKKYQEELDKLTSGYKTAQLQAEATNTRIVIGVCIAISAIAILFAILY